MLETVFAISLLLGIFMPAGNQTLTLIDVRPKTLFDNIGRRVGKITIWKWFSSCWTESLVQKSG